jgi:cobalamin biosynthesis protein CobT
LYYKVATKLFVVIAITCVFAVALTLITFPSSTGMIQDIFAQITPASLGDDSGNSTIITNTNNIDQLSTLTSNVTNSSSIFQLATLSSYQPITPSSNSGGLSSDDDEAPSNDDDDDNNSDDDSDNDNGNTIIITSTGNYDSEDDDDNSDYNDGYYDDNVDTSDISIGSGGSGAFASAGGSGAFASVG